MVLRHDTDLLARIQEHAGRRRDVHVEGVAVLLQQLHETHMHPVLPKIIHDALRHGAVLITVIHDERITLIEVSVALKPRCMGILKIN